MLQWDIDDDSGTLTRLSDALGMGGVGSDTDHAEDDDDDIDEMKLPQLRNLIQQIK